MKIIIKRKKHRRPRIRLTVGVVREQDQPASFCETGNTFHKGKFLMALILTDSQQVQLSVAFADKKGNPAKVDGAPAWSVSDPAILTVTAAPDGLSAVVAAVGPIGTAQVSLKADADLGAGVKEVIGTLDIGVVAGEAVSAVLTGGAPTEQP